MMSTIKALFYTRKDTERSSSGRYEKRPFKKVLCREISTVRQPSCRGYIVTCCLLLPFFCFVTFSRLFMYSQIQVCEEEF